MKVLPKAGTYNARRTRPIAVSESDNGALMAWIEYALTNADVAFTGVHSICLGKMDGTLMTKNFETLHKVFPTWETNDPFDLETIEVPEGDGAEFELADCYIDDTYIPANSTDGQPVLQFKARWLNPLGVSRVPVLADDEKEAIKSKWAGKWNSLGSSPVAVKPAAAAPAAKKPAPVKKPEPAAEAPAAAPAKRAPKKTARVSTADDVYAALDKWNKSQDDPMSDDDLANNKFYPACDKVSGKKDTDITALTPEQWGEVADILGL